MSKPQWRKNWEVRHRQPLNNRRQGRGNEVTQKEKRQMQTMRNQGKTIEEIAWEMNRSYATVTRHTHPRLRRK